MLLLGGCAGLDVGFGNIYEALRTREALTNTTTQATPDASYAEYEAARQERVRSQAHSGRETQVDSGPPRNNGVPTPGISPGRNSVE